MKDNGTEVNPGAWAGLALFRCVFNAFFVQTYFDPDEYWQSLEVAHRLTFGYGHLTWEWMPNVAIRSYVHPMLFASFYKGVACLSLDSRFVIAYGPRVLQGAFITVTDFYTYKLAKVLCGNVVAKYTLVVQGVSWFYFYCGIRSYSNSLEMALLIPALFYWYSSKEEKRKALSVAALSVAVRGPSAVICWVYIGLRHLLLGLKSRNERVTFIVKQVLPVAVMSNVFILVVDRIGYGFWTCTLFNFIHWNIMEDISSEYGVHPSYWYITQGLPVTVGTFMPFAVVGGYLALKTRHRVGVLVELGAFFVAVISMVGHKELRFLLPILPLVHICCGLAFFHASLQVDGWTRQRRVLWKVVVVAVVTSNVVAIWYLSRVHQRGSLEVVDYLANDPRVKDVDFLTRCHATPFHSHIHDSSVRLRFLDCSPGIEALRDDPEKSYSLVHGIEEEDAFRENKLAFVRARYADKELPTHIVWEGSGLDEDARSYLEQLGYSRAASFANGFDGSHFDVHVFSDTQ